MGWLPNYSNPIFGLGELAETLEEVMRLPEWARRRWLRNQDGRKRGKFIYRYQDFDPRNSLSMRKADDLIVESKLYLPSPSSFNDPYEFQARLILDSDPVKRRAHFRKTGKKLKLKGKDLEVRLRELMRRSNDDPYAMDKVLEQTKEHWGIACFSLNPRLLRMWSHYASGHSGIGLQFDAAKDVGFAIQTLEVNYQPEVATLHWPAEQDRILDDVLLRKWDAWKDEEEVRYTSKMIVNAHLPLSPAFLSGIILGNRFPDSSMPTLNDFLRRREVSRLSLNPTLPR